MHGETKKGQQAIKKFEAADDLVVFCVRVRTIGRLNALHLGQGILSFPTGVHFSTVVLKHFWWEV